MKQFHKAWILGLLASCAMASTVQAKPTWCPNNSFQLELKEVFENGAYSVKATHPAGGLTPVLIIPVAPRSFQAIDAMKAAVVADAQATVERVAKNLAKTCRIKVGYDNITVTKTAERLFEESRKLAPAEEKLVVADSKTTVVPTVSEAERKAAQELDRQNQINDENRFEELSASYEIANLKGFLKDYCATTPNPKFTTELQVATKGGGSTGRIVAQVTVFADKSDLVVIKKVPTSESYAIYTNDVYRANVQKKALGSIENDCTAIKDAAVLEAKRLADEKAAADALAAEQVARQALIKQAQEEEAQRQAQEEAARIAEKEKAERDARAAAAREANEAARRNEATPYTRVDSGSFIKTHCAVEKPKFRVEYQLPDISTSLASSATIQIYVYAQTDHGNEILKRIPRIVRTNDMLTWKELADSEANAMVKMCKNANPKALPEVTKVGF